MKVLKNSSLNTVFILTFIFIIQQTSFVFAEDYNDIQKYIDEIDREADLYLQNGSGNNRQQVNIYKSRANLGHKTRTKTKVKLSTSTRAESTTTITNSDTQNHSISFNKISDQLDNWSHSWSKGDLQNYIKIYSKDYSPRSKTRTQWINNRKQRIKPEKKIKINISDITYKIIKKNKVIKTIFRQKYSSIHYSDASKKQIIWKNINGIWLISSESTIR